MKQIRLYSGLLLSLSLVFASCSSSSDDSGNPPTDDDNPPTGITPPTAQAFNNLREAALDEFTHSVNVQVESSDALLDISLPNEIEVLVAKTCVNHNDDILDSGNVDVEFINLTDKASLLITGVATMGKNSEEETAILMSKNTFSLNMFLDGQPLELFCGYTIKIPVTGGIDNDISLWYGSSDENVIWQETEQGLLTFPPDENDPYTAGQVKPFGWVSFGKIYAENDQKTIFEADIPNGYNASNSAVYLSFDGNNSTLARLDSFEDGVFSQSGIPVGKDCQVIFVSEFEGKWVYAIKSATIVANGSVTFETSDLKTATQAEMITKLNALP